MDITMPSIRTNNKKKPVINFRNPEEWQNYMIVSDKYASKMKEIVENIRMCFTDLESHLLGTTWLPSRM